MLQALETLQPSKNTGQNGGVSTKRTGYKAAGFKWLQRQVSSDRYMVTASKWSRSSARHIPLNCKSLVN